MTTPTPTHRTHPTPLPAMALLGRASICVAVSTGSERHRKRRLAAPLTGEDILVSVFALVLRLLALFAGIQQFALLLLKYLVAERGRKTGKKERKKEKERNDETFCESSRKLLAAPMKRKQTVKV